MVEKWNREAILRWILGREAQGLPVNAQVAIKEDASLHRGALRCFGSWDNALASAGIRKHDRQWSERRIIADIRRAAKHPGNLRHAAMIRRRRRLYEAAVGMFATWKQALIASGIDPNAARMFRKWDRESVIEGILSRAVKNEPLGSTTVRPPCLRNAGIKVFGSWPRAIRSAGLDPDEYIGIHPRRDPRRWSRRLVVDEILNRLRERKALNSEAVRRDDQPLFAAARRFFVNWPTALTHAGLDPNEYRRDGRRKTSLACSRIPPQGARQSFSAFAS